MNSESNNGLYPIFCKLAANNNTVFKSFKRDPIYNAILENVSFEKGSEYIDCFVNNKLIIDNIQKFKINDVLGNPKKFNYNIGSFSPTTLQYIKILSDLSKYDLDNTHIIEIGPGYGGQYCVLRQLFKPKKYTFIDLNPVLKLVKKYVSYLKLDDIELEYIDYLDIHTNIFSNLIISNFSISECDYNLQDQYINNIVNTSLHGYILYDNLRGYNHLEFIENVKEKNIIISEEKPKNTDNTVLLSW
jgi:hypothetical protein